MFGFAVGNFKSAFQFAVNLDVYSVVNSQGKDISISPNSYRSLFNYALLCLKGQVERHCTADAIAQSYLQQAVAMGSVDAMIYLDEHYLKMKEKFVDGLGLVCDELAKIAQQEKKRPYRTGNKEGRNALCGCVSGRKHKICCGVGL